jgi:hypothetical protein
VTTAYQDYGEASLKPLLDTAKNILSDDILRSIGLDIHLDLKGREAHTLFALRNHANVLSFVPKQHEDDWNHFLTDA